MDSLDQDYKLLNKHTSVETEYPLTLTLTAYEQNYLCFNVRTLLFPLVLQIQELKGRGTVYIGYDRPYPGLPKPSKKIGLKHNVTQGEEEKVYDCKFIIVKDGFHVLAKSIHENIQKIFITVSAASQILCFTAMVSEFLNPLQKQTNKEQTFHFPVQMRQRSKTLEILPKMQERGEGRKVSKKLYDAKGHRFPQKVFTMTSKFTTPPNYIHLNETCLQEFSKSKTGSFNILKKQRNKQSQWRVKANLTKIQQFQGKQRELEEKASNCKKIIESYQQNFIKKEQNKQKFHGLVAICMFTSIACRKMLQAHESYQMFIRNTFAVGWLTKKFTSKIILNHRKVTESIPFFKKRNLMGSFHFLQMASKSLHGESKIAGSKIILSLFLHLKPAFELNHAFKKAANYKKAVKLIEDRWYLKHQNRMKMLIIFSRFHIQKMLAEHPHLKLFLAKFQSQGQCQDIVFQYLCDQAQKYGRLVSQYESKTQQRSKINEINAKIRLKNSKKPTYKHKKELEVGRKLLRPLPRIFRNLDILKTMIRAYFELEYKKKVKRTIRRS